MTCKNCGANLPENSVFCSKCGSQIPPAGVNNGDETVLLSREENRTPLLGRDSLSPYDDKTALMLADPEDDKTAFLGDMQSGQNNNSPSVNGAAPVKYTEDFWEGYKVLGIIGQGGGGIVFKAIHTRLNKEVVIKQIINSNGSLNRNETDLLKGLKHTYLPQVLDFIEKDGQCYTVMDFIAGSDIEKLSKNGKKFSVKEITNIALQLCEAVSYLHSFKPPIIHSDIKPANVMLQPDGNICLIDFNVSLIFDKNAKTIGGTLGYAPPEQLGISLSDIKSNSEGTLVLGKERLHIDERSDVFSIGALLYFMITGEKPKTNYNCQPVSDFRKDIPDGLLHVVTTAMMLNPAKRYKNAGEMLSAIKNIGKLDKRYRGLKARRIIATFLAVTLMGASVLVNRQGSVKLKQEHEEKYQGYVTQMSEMIEQGKYEDAQPVIEAAEKFEPTRIEPYFNRTKIMFFNSDYQQCMTYPDTVITSEIKENEQNDLKLAAQMYEMAAESAFELEEYDSAAESYQQALMYDNQLIECYRDLTISYARLGKIDQAEKTLQLARDAGLLVDRLELMQGEIYSAKSNPKSAYESFVKTADMTKDDYIRFRAILVCDKTMLADTENVKENADKMITFLEKQKDLVSAEYESIVKEMLANEYALADQFDNAAKIYEELMTEGMLNYSMEKNYFNLLFVKIRDYGKASELLKSMKGQNPDDYWVYMNSAYLLISVENAKEDQTQRDYSKANEEYKLAEEKYKTFTLNGKSDANMDNLRNSIKELKSYGWIKEG